MDAGYLWTSQEIYDDTEDRETYVKYGQVYGSRNDRQETWWRREPRRTNESVRDVKGEA
jgi:hypothetical protein